MITKSHLSSFLAGIVGATAIHTLIQMLLWTLSLGRTLADYLLIWFILLPIPLVLGIVAGLLVSISCRSRCQMWAFILAAIGMIGAMVSIAFGASGHPGDDIISSFGGPILSGTVVELGIAAIAGIGSYLFNRLHS